MPKNKNRIKKSRKVRTATNTKRASAKSPTGPTTEQLRDFVREEGAVWLKDPNITSVGIGYKTVDGGKTKELCLQFTVGKKVPETQLESLGTQVIPKKIRVGGYEVETDVLERTFRPSYELVKLEAKDPRKQRLQTISPGVSVSHPSGTAGTLGAIVYDARDGAACILSNWHVLHTPTGALGDSVVQPGPYDDDRVTENRAGTLIRSHLGVARHVGRDEPRRHQRACRWRGHRRARHRREHAAGEEFLRPVAYRLKPCGALALELHHPHPARRARHSGGGEGFAGQRPLP